MRTGIKFYGDDIRMDKERRDGIAIYFIAVYDHKTKNWEQKIEIADYGIADKYAIRLLTSSGAKNKKIEIYK